MQYIPQYIIRNLHNKNPQATCMTFMSSNIFMLLLSLEMFFQFGGFLSNCTLYSNVREAIKIQTVRMLTANSWFPSVYDFFMLPFVLFWIPCISKTFFFSQSTNCFFIEGLLECLGFLESVKNLICLGFFGFVSIVVTW